MLEIYFSSNNSKDITLYLIDSKDVVEEISKDTNPEKLNSLKALTLSTTHYPEIKHFALVTEGFENASVEFNIETLSPTYKLLLGVPGTSNAFAISKKLGLDINILNRAKSLVEKNDIDIDFSYKQKFIKNK